jgi:heat shock protein HslJ
MATKMAGPPELNGLETRFLRALEQVTAWRIDRGELELMADDKPVARFSANR